MNPVRTVYNKKWIPYKSQVDFYLCSEPVNFDAPVTTVHGFFWEGDHLLLVKHKTRGWEVPGGHIEEGEDYIAAMKRELMEEAQMKCGPVRWLGYLKKTALEPLPPSCVYPHPLSYCIFFSADIIGRGEFIGDDSIEDAKFSSIHEAVRVPWIEAYAEYFNAARS